MKTSPLTRMAALDVCHSCLADPEAALLKRNLHYEWNDAMRAFSAGGGLPRLDVELGFSCCEQGFHHKALKLWVDEVEVGDPIFDDRVYVRTSNRETTAAILANEGVQSAILTFVSGMRNDRFVFSHVTLEKGTLTARAIPMAGVPEEAALEFRQNFAALMVHLDNHATDGLDS